MNVVFAIVRQIVIDDHGDLLNIDTTSQQVGGDEDTTGSSSELFHNQLTFALWHLAVLLVSDRIVGVLSICGLAHDPKMRDFQS